MVGHGYGGHPQAHGTSYFGDDEDEEEVWNTGLDEDDGYCEHHEHLEDGASEVMFKPKAIRRVLGMCFLHPSTEFMVYLLGEDRRDEGERPTVQDVYVPVQEVSAGSVHREQTVDEEVPNNVIGVLHKHPGNGAQRFSGIDDHQLNINHDISIVIPKNGALADWRGEVRHHLDCGCTDRRDACVVHDILDENLIEMSQENVSPLRSDGKNRATERSIH